MTTQLMTNIDSYFYNFIDKESRENKISKRELLETIIASYIEKKEHSRLEKAYKSMGKDEEYLSEMTNNARYLGNL